MEYGPLINRVVKTLLALLLGTGQEFVFQILAVIIWIRFWGSDLYSEWLMLFLFPNLITRGNAGLFHGATSTLIRQYSQHDYSSAGVTYSSLRIAQFLFLFFVGLVYAAAGFVVAHYVALRTITTVEVGVIAFLFFCQFAGFQIQQATLCLVKADQRAPTAVMWQNGARLTYIFFLLAGAVITGPVFSLLAAVLAQSLVVALTVTVSRAPRSKISAGLNNARPGEVLSLMKKGVEFSLFPFGQTITHSVSVWTLGYFLGAPVGAAFHNLRTISRSLVLIARSVERAVRFELSLLFAQREFLAAAKLSTNAVRNTVVFCGLSVVALVLVGNEIFQVLTDGQLTFDRGAFALLCASSLFYSVSLIFLAVPFSLNRHSRLAAGYAAVSLFSCVLYIPVASLGVAAVATVTMFADLVFFVAVYQTSSRMIKENRPID